MNNKLTGKKMYLDNWLDVLIKNINYNTEINNKFIDKSEEYKKFIERNNKLLKKLDTYKKEEPDGRVYFYFFPNELITMVWILLENSVSRGEI